MKPIFKTKLREFNKTYSKMPKERKSLLKVAIFVGISVLVMNYFMFPSIDKLAVSKDNFEVAQSEKNNLLKEKETLIIQQANKSDKHLLKQKKDLLVEIEKMLRESKNNNYIPTDKVSTVIKSIVDNINQVKVVSFKNIPSGESEIKTEGNSNIVVKHNFYIKVNGSFQGIYDVLSNLEKTQGINISLVEIKKEETGLTASFNFYVVNTNKNILNF